MKWLRRFWPYVLLAVLVSVNVVVFVQRNNLADWWQLRDYQAPKDIATLAHDTTMTDFAKRLFYVNHPVLEDKQSFNKHCADKGEETAVLGCYHGNRQGIFLYDVSDARLQGVRQVTAAHEVLHQAYDRLGAKERTRIEGLLQNYYRSGLTEEDVKIKLESYRRQGTQVLVSEMHSIFGSEVRNLPHELDAYYSRYFQNRNKLVGFSDVYQAEFTRRKELVAQFDAQLASLKTQIEQDKAALETKQQFLNAKEQEINQDVAVQDAAEYSADVQVYNATVESYNRLLAAARKRIDEYNTIVAQRNEIAVQEQELQQALDSRIAPTPMQ